MTETHFRWPGRYAMWREEGRLWLEVEVGARGERATHRVPLAPAQGYALLMNRRRTELLYAIAEAMAGSGAFDADRLAALVERCGVGSEVEIVALADAWNGDGVVAHVMGDVLGRALPGSDAPRWFAPIRRAVRG
ncbi:MAG: hypothetical protein AAF844_04765 [Pseudomonadota bacterium]